MSDPTMPATPAGSATPPAPAEPDPDEAVPAEEAPEFAATALPDDPAAAAAAGPRPTPPRIVHPAGCGCCPPPADDTPRRAANRPGLSSVAYRVGTHRDFRRTMLAALARTDAARGLTTRDDHDFTVALVDAFASMADVLTFYQERQANEAWLRTATQRRSVLELARLTGYQLKPGVAGSADLAFTLDASPGAPESVVVEKGTAVQSTPKPGEKAVVYETVADIEARPAWNAIRARYLRRHGLPYAKRTLVFEGPATNISPGDGVLWEQTGRAMFGIAVAVDVVPAAPAHNGHAPHPAHTVVTLHRVATKHVHQSAITFTDPAPPLGGPAAALEGKHVRAADLEARAVAQKFSVKEVFANLAACPSPPATAWVFRAKARVFGHNAPAWKALPPSLRGYDYESDSGGTWKVKGGPYVNDENTWAEQTLAHFDGQAASQPAVFLDTAYRGVGDVVVLRDGDAWGAWSVTGAQDHSLTAFTVNGPSTRVNLDAGSGLDWLGIRGTEVFMKGERLPLAKVPVAEPVNGHRIRLDTWVGGLRAGQRVSIRGEHHARRGTWGRHVTTLARVEHDLRRHGSTVVWLVDKLPAALVRDTVVVNANVAPATEGQSTSELLGGGDGRVPFQRFPLRQPPLTYTSASTPSGAASTLEVYVNDVRWHEVDTLYRRGPHAHVFATRLEADGTTVVQFGDGRTGARLPTGEQNVRAVYRKGSGLAGLVDEGRLNMLLTRKSGVTDVVNPQAADGAADPERLADARRNAPLHVRTLGRVVSGRDYEDFSAAFPGVGKAIAVWARAQQAQGVLVTVAGPHGRDIDPTGTTATALLQALAKAGDPLVPVRVVPFQSRLFRVAASVKVDPDRVRAQVVGDVEAALRHAFSFEARRFGQAVAPSEVVAVMQDVAGVVAVELADLHRSAAAPTGSPHLLSATMPMAGADINALGAELLTLDPAPLKLGLLA